jgi:hypothetical protein
MWRNARWCRHHRARLNPDIPCAHSSWRQKLSRQWCRSQRSKVKYRQTRQKCNAMWPLPSFLGVVHALAWGENKLRARTCVSNSSQQCDLRVPIVENHCCATTISNGTSTRNHSDATMNWHNNGTRLTSYATMTGSQRNKYLCDAAWRTCFECLCTPRSTPF